MVEEMVPSVCNNGVFITFLLQRIFLIKGNKLQTFKPQKKLTENTILSFGIWNSVAVTLKVKVNADSSRTIATIRYVN